MPPVVIRAQDYNCRVCGGFGVIFDGKAIIKCVSCKGLGIKI